MAGSRTRARGGEAGTGRPSGGRRGIRPDDAGRTLAARVVHVQRTSGQQGRNRPPRASNVSPSRGPPRAYFLHERVGETWTSDRVMVDGDHTHMDGHQRYDRVQGTGKRPGAVGEAAPQPGPALPDAVA